ncbi:hypothetical protein L9F63_009417 [Diploptera punctata]|uniref:Uncharacterized protein n=1 Tax=Diploptera punctata TaxID=6984 RepID=A0AAD8AJN5_DIPPU|nr:hypothetical protein L9F63_009417 [Diploptera punctata]
MFLRHCSAGEHFSPTLKKCVNRDIAGCIKHWYCILVVISVSILLTPVRSAGTSSTINCSPINNVPLPSICTEYSPKNNVAHPSICTDYYFCAYNKMFLRHCSAGEHFSPTLKKCVNRDIAGCIKQCDALVNDANGTWEPVSCTAGPNKVGSICSITCAQNMELKGSSSITCTDYGWNSTNGNLIPSCVELECFSEDMKNAINETLTVNAGILFVIDESGSIGQTDYLKSKQFIKDIVDSFPLSRTRTAGVITFDDYPIVRIPLTETSTDNFKDMVDSIPYRGQGTDVLEALEAALTEIQSHATGSLYLVILITDGISETDATPAANALKNLDHPVFTIGVNKQRLTYVESLSSMGKNGIRHFFHTRDFDILKSIGSYINRPTSTAAATQNKCK